MNIKILFYALSISLVSLTCVQATSALPTAITLVQGDITKQVFEKPGSSAIVNAANSMLTGGEGVCGAIYKAAGWDNKKMHRYFPEDEDGIRCRVGGAVLYSGKSSLPCTHVIHAVGPDCRKEDQEKNKADLLANAYWNSLEIAYETGVISTIAFPCISTGIYGYAPVEAAKIAVDTVVDFTSKFPELIEVRFVVFDSDTFEMYKMWLQELANYHLIIPLASSSSAALAYSVSPAVSAASISDAAAANIDELAALVGHWQ